MLRNLTFVVLATVLPAAYSPLTGADVQPSEEMKEAMKAQAERPQRGDTSITAFQNDLRQAANLGDPVAKFMLGTLLMKDNQEEALKLLREAAEEGCAGAAGVLAVGGIAQGSSEARRWLNQAIQGGDAGSMALVSSFYYRGDHGYSKDPVAALAWAELAKARSYNRGLSLGVDQLVNRIHLEIADEEISQSAALLRKLEHDYPKVDFYLCGQSAP